MSKPGLRIKQNAQTQRSVRNCLCMASPEHSNVAGAYIFPLVGHGNDILIFQMRPFAVSPSEFAIIYRRNAIAGVEPMLHIIMIELFTP